ncbi:hypothetical protein C1637_15885 [Chryseobacterium lactis]|uniref:CPBP family intramembrane metalloprotease n=2 Tax=Chryseobacterium lactis TaxID=1241981 RepID=A0A3G6RJH0_CHRLC|nr:CPBP family intramembrane metalloprotease [Chryseobacterium lactis]AZB04358.1 CPBP family intramembrane metalloprotease [Chryseobacterium lactis]PNW12529.1 hypothetical protein C1637_15885 [Chryseobacterium lactis]
MLYAFPAISFFTGIKSNTAGSFYISRIVLWVVLIIIFLYTLFVERGSFLLQEEKKYAVSFYAKAVIGLYLASVFGSAFLNILVHLVTHENTSDKLVAISYLFKNDYFLIIFTCLTAGVMEELLMRGYMQPRIEKIYNSSIAGIVISAVLFGILHSTYGTIGQVVITSFIGIVFALFYKKYSNIKILIICHFMIDFVSLMIMNFIDFKHLSVF